MHKKQNTVSLSSALGLPKTKEEVLKLLESHPDALARYNQFPHEQQEECIHFMCGNRGAKILYNSFFLHIFDPQTQPRRLESLLSALLDRHVKIKAVLPREGIQLNESGSFVIMDILVEFEDGTIFNLEIQKVGYYFPGQRTSCYVSDLIMRQYNRLRAKSTKKHPFHYRDMKPVHVLVLMEDSPSEFAEAAPEYIHVKQVSYSSGAIVPELGQITYVSLDTFQNVVQNNIDNELHAWLTFLCNDDPEVILKLITAYPSFIPVYEDIARFRSDPEEVTAMFSEALREMDHNLELYMIEEARKELEAIKKEKEAVIKERNSVVKERDSVVKERDSVVKERDSVVKERDAVQSENEKFKAFLTLHGYSYEDILSETDA